MGACNASYSNAKIRMNRFPSCIESICKKRRGREKRKKEKLSTNLAARLHISRLYSSDRRMSIVSPLRPHSTCFPVHHRSSRSPHPVPKTFSPAVFGERHALQIKIRRNVTKSVHEREYLKRVSSIPLTVNRFLFRVPSGISIHE